MRKGAFISTKLVVVLQEGSLPPCYEQDNAKICPFSFAKIGDTVFDFVPSGGNGFGPNTYNGCFYFQFSAGSQKDTTLQNA